MFAADRLRIVHREMHGVVVVSICIVARRVCVRVTLRVWIGLFAGTPYCWAVDEYSPSAFVFNCDMDNNMQCGIVEARYVPESVKVILVLKTHPAGRNVLALFHAEGMQPVHRM